VSLAQRLADWQYVPLRRAWKACCVLWFGAAWAMVAVPLAVAPGPTRRFAGRQVRRVIADGVEMFASAGASAVVAVMIGEMLSGSVVL
jgi:hypothetical protein